MEEFRLPFEEEVGCYPTLDDMQDCVVQKKSRPTFKETWVKHKVNTVDIRVFIRSQFIAIVAQYFTTLYSYAVNNMLLTSLMLASGH